MDDEEYTYQALQEPLYRVETGNYEYRLILRCRQDAKLRFANLRSDVLVKLELLDQKHVQDVITQLQKFLSCLAVMNSESYSILKEANYFPLEVDLSNNCTFNYPDLNASPYQENHEEEDEEVDEAKIQAEILGDMGIEVTEESSLQDLFDSLTLNPQTLPVSKPNQALHLLHQEEPVMNLLDTADEAEKQGTTSRTIDDLLQ